MTPPLLLGNDLVWLADPANVGRSGDRALLDRVLTARERLMVQVSPDPDRMLWSLWAAKEAAFKAFGRHEPDLAFSPVRFEVVPVPQSKLATVTLGDRQAPVRWVQGPDWVHAVVAEGPVVDAVERRPEGVEESTHVRDLAVRLAGGRGTIGDRPPVWRFGVEARPVSLSHDGPYSAVVFPRG